MAGGKVHVLKVCHVPCRYDDATTVGVVLDSVHRLLYLVDESSVVVGPRTPLVSIDRTEFAVLVSPFVPDSHTVFLQVAHIGVAI